MLTKGFLALSTTLGLWVLQETTPRDFHLRVAFEVCSSDVIDTARDEYVRTIRPGLTRAVRLNLTPSQRRQIYTLVRNARLEEYPDEFTPPLTLMREPGPVYRIELSSSGHRYVVNWTDYGSTSAEAQRLRTMLDQLRKLILALPAVRQLPKSEIFCL